MSDLTALVGSRICHDLISPIGAIGNGMELLAMTAEGSGVGEEEMALIAASVASANARIRLFRIAFGAASPEAEIAGHEIRDILADHYGPSRYDVTASLPVALPRALAKVALLAVLCAETALPRGGTITLSSEDDRMALTAQGERLTLTPNLWMPLCEGRAPEDALAASEVQFALLPQALAAIGRHLRLDHSETRLDLGF